jgi:TolA-binding protein
MERRTPILISAVAVVAIGLMGSVMMIRRGQIRDTTETQLAVAQSLVAQHRADQAVALLKNLRTTVNDRALIARLLYIQGTASLDLKNFDDAVQAFRESVDLSAGTPLQPLALANLGFSQEQKKDYVSAAATYTRFMTDDGTHFLAPRIQLALGRTLYAAGKNDDARKALGQLIDLYPTSIWAQNARDIMGRHK